MPGFTIVLLAGSLSFGGPKRPEPVDRWLGRDKAKHFAVSLVMQAAGHSVLRANGYRYREAAWTAAGVTLSAGVAKELWDRQAGRAFSVRDLAADAAGTGTGATLMRQTAP